jgi:hypothetical protein
LNRPINNAWQKKFNASTQEVEDWLNVEITHLKEEHAKKEAEWATEH